MDQWQQGQKIRLEDESFSEKAVSIKDKEIHASDDPDEKCEIDTIDISDITTRARPSGR